MSSPCPCGRRLMRTAIAPATSLATGSVIALDLDYAVERFGDLLDQPARDRLLRHRLPVLGLAFGNQVDGVVVAAHRVVASSRGNVVGDDPVDPLALALAGGVVEHVLGLRGETDEQLRPLA